MSTKALTGLTLVMLSTCGDEEPASTGPDYTCTSIYDSGCRYSADVAITGGTLTDAATHTTSQGWGTSVSFQDIAGVVTVTDADGEPPVSCSFIADLDIGTSIEGDDAIVTSISQVELDDSCPIRCAWFLPAAGTFDATRGRYSLSPFESQWSLQLGDWAPEEPYSHEFFATQISSTSYGAAASLDAPVQLYPTDWEAPLALPVGGSVEPSCSF